MFPVHTLRTTRCGCCLCRLVQPHICQASMKSGHENFISFKQYKWLKRIYMLYGSPNGLVGMQRYSNWAECSRIHLIRSPLWHLFCSSHQKQAGERHTVYKYQWMRRHRRRVNKLIWIRMENVRKFVVIVIHISVVCFVQDQELGHDYTQSQLMFVYWRRRKRRRALQKVLLFPRPCLFSVPSYLCN